MGELSNQQKYAEQKKQQIAKLKASEGNGKDVAYYEGWTKPQIALIQKTITNF